MGSGFVCAPLAPQGPPKQVEIRSDRKRTDKPNRQASSLCVSSHFQVVRQSSRFAACNLISSPHGDPNSAQVERMSNTGWQRSVGLTGLIG